MIQDLHPWKQLYEVVSLLAPVFLFSILSSIVIYLVFVIFIPSLSRHTIFHANADAIRDNLENESSKPPTAEPAYQGEFGYAGSFAYLVLASQFGLVLGMLVKLVGGFTALEKSTPNTLIGAIGTVLVIVLGVIGSLFAESDRVNLRKPLGAINFLLSFLVSGFYWKLLERAV